MKASDIPEKPILEFLGDLTPTWATIFENDNPYFDKPNSVWNVIDEKFPYKVGLAKMRNLIKRGLVDGCPCGCRGDFVITDKGREYLSNL